MVMRKRSLIDFLQVIANPILPAQLVRATGVRRQRGAGEAYQ
jgi:hypothetical protein